MITITSLKKRFGRLEVLRGADLTVVPGRVTAILGPNGAGKTTLIKSILGLTRPDSGRILFDGERIGSDEKYRARIGYMPQLARFPENLSARELIAMLRSLRGAEVAVDEELIERFELEPHMDKPLRTLSGGSRQKVNAVAAFLFRPELVILDEPTAGLDPVSSGVLKDRILEQKAAGRTFILTSHIMSELEELADDVAFLVEGIVRFAGPVHDLKLETRQLNLERAIAQMMKKEAAA
jgi:Cu-processing system ATP-binding protein